MAALSGCDAERDNGRQIGGPPAAAAGDPRVPAAGPRETGTPSARLGGRLNYIVGHAVFGGSRVPYGGPRSMFSAAVNLALR
jgi:hypothetical protein